LFSKFLTKCKKSPEKSPFWRQVNRFLERVERDAFGNMDSLIKVTFSGDIKSIDEIAFENCINLTEVNFYGSIPVIEREVFKNTGVENLSRSLYF
jgi:hypothetical protein